MDPNRRSFHIRAVNNAVIQEVSVFCIGQGIHHWTEDGGQLTITNSNSNWGGCAALSEGYNDSSFTADTNWDISRIKVADNLAALAGNVRKIFLGTISAVSSSQITLTTDLADSLINPGVPEAVASDGYTLRDGSYVWVENPLGKDWRTTFTSTAWSPSSADVLNVSAALENQDGELPGINLAEVDNAVGKRVYIRRLVDTRTPEQRRYSLKLSNTNATVRLPVRDYVLQTNTSDALIDSELPEDRALLVQSSGSATVTGVSTAAEIVLRRGNASVQWATGTSYKKGETVKYNNKHFTCSKDNSDVLFTGRKLERKLCSHAFCFQPRRFYKTETPILIFDKDSSGNEESITLGYNLNSVWQSDSLIQDQYRSALDYRGVHSFLLGIGFASGQAHQILYPNPASSRELDPSSLSDMANFTPSSGVANGLGNWAVEFRRPSIITMFGQAYEYAGFLNYTKARPEYQGQLSEQNKFTYFFTSADGGRVYGSGFNEEGFRVSPRGLENVLTGETISVENLGSSDLTIDEPTELTNLSLDGTTNISGSLNITASTDFGSNAKATAEKFGTGVIASTSAIAGAAPATPSNPGEAEFVNPAGLQFFKQNEKPCHPALCGRRGDYCSRRA